MSDKIEVGEYIRTDIGNIFQYTDKMKEFVDEHLSKSDKNNIEYLGKIVRHGKEAGKTFCYLHYDVGKTFTDYQIKEVLSKEQYEKNCYRAGE